MIRTFVAQNAAGQIDAARAAGMLEGVNGYTRAVAVRFLAWYFGAPGPTEKTMLRWLRDIFYDVFLNLTNVASVRAAADVSGRQLQAHLDGVIAARKRQLGAGEAAIDDVLGRLIALQGPSRQWFDDDALRRNLSGLMVGVVETTSKFVTLALAELLRRPPAFARAKAAALAGDIERVRAYAYEAARFNPATPLLFRYCPRDTQIGAGRGRPRTLRAGTKIVLGNISAMFDPAAFEAPRAFRLDHDSAALHFGYGLHRCFGAAISDILVSELVAAVLRLRGLRRPGGRAGAIRWEGPFPQRFLLEFD